MFSFFEYVYLSLNNPGCLSQWYSVCMRLLGHICDFCNVWIICLWVCAFGGIWTLMDANACLYSSVCDQDWMFTYSQPRQKGLAWERTSKKREQTGRRRGEGRRERQRDGVEGRRHEERSEKKKKNQKAEGDSRDLKLKRGRVESQQGHKSDLGMAPLQVIPLLCVLGNASLPKEWK